MAQHSRTDRADRADRTRAYRAEQPMAADDVRARLQRLSVRQQRFQKHLADSLRVDGAGLEAMDHLIATGPSTPSELARRIGVSTAAMSLVLNRLEDAGHIRRHPHPSDGRKLVVTAAEQSADDAYAHVLPMIEGVETLVGTLTAHDRAVVESFLDRLIEVYDASTRAAP